MIAIQMIFPAGRYHATPWGRHVNEADVEWPPSPWRLIRGLIATWHRKGDHERFSEKALKGLVEILAEKLPLFGLPVVRHAHTRHYMPVAGNKPTLVFDAFVQMDKKAPLVVVWPDIELDENALSLLDDLISKLGYLGRAESWVIATRLSGWDGKINCWPAEENHFQPDFQTESVTLFSPYSASVYHEQRNLLMKENDLTQTTDKKTKLTTKARKILATLPENLSDAMSVETGDLQAVGWSAPPAARRVRYLRPYQALNGTMKRKYRISSNQTSSIARLQLVGKPLPKVEDSVRIGEIFRKALIHSLDKRMKLEVPPIVSGHDLPMENRHKHAFFLPEDEDHDGYIDHVNLYIPDGIPIDALVALSRRMDKLWLDGGQEWRLVFDAAGDSVGSLGTSSCIWRSVTPYLHPWHRKKDFGVEEQILKECRLRGLPEPQVEYLETIPVGISKRPRNPLHFRRFREKRGLVQPDRQGCFLRLGFRENIKGPLALGFGCHYGLGLFIPES